MARKTGSACRQLQLHAFHRILQAGNRGVQEVKRVGIEGRAATSLVRERNRAKS
jgi:hypothetical protein